MNSPISGLLAEAVMQRLDNIAISVFKPKLWTRCIYDAFVRPKYSEVEEAQITIDSLFESITFTMKLGQDQE